MFFSPWCEYWVKNKPKHAINNTQFTLIKIIEYSAGRALKVSSNKLGQESTSGARTKARKGFSRYPPLTKASLLVSVLDIGVLHQLLLEKRICYWEGRDYKAGLKTKGLVWSFHFKVKETWHRKAWLVKAPSLNTCFTSTSSWLVLLLGKLSIYCVLMRRLWLK